MFDAASSNSRGSGSNTLTLSHTCSGVDRVLYAAVHGADQTWSATYNGVAMEELYDGNPGSPFKHISVYRLVAPATGANNLVFTSSGTTAAIGCAVSHTGIDQTTPNDAIQVATGSGTESSGTVSSETGDVVIDFTVANQSSAQVEGAGQTPRVNAFNADEFVWIGSSEEAGAATNTMTWGLSPSNGWTVAVLNLNAAAGGGGAQLMGQISI